jgi:hypothetical protein
MSDDREAIFSRIRGALAPLRERAPLPQYDAEIAVLRQVIAGRDLVELFARADQKVNGLALKSAAALAAHLRAAAGCAAIAIRCSGRGSRRILAAIFKSRPRSIARGLMITRLASRVRRGPSRSRGPSS